jgi:hypothetical protein
LLKSMKTGRRKASMPFQSGVTSRFDHGSSSLSISRSCSRLSYTCLSELLTREHTSTARAIYSLCPIHRSAMQHEINEHTQTAHHRKSTCRKAAISSAPSKVASTGASTRRPGARVQLRQCSLSTAGQTARKPASKDPSVNFLYESATKIFAIATNPKLIPTSRQRPYSATGSGICGSRISVA